MTVMDVSTARNLNLRRSRLAIASALVLASASIIVVQLRATPSQAFPSTLIPSQGAYLGSWVAPRGDESERAALQRVESQIGRKFDIYHTYTKWNMAIPSATSWAAQNGRIPMINWSAQRTDGSIVSWSSIANGEQDAWIGERADAFRNFGFPVYLVFHHEPEDDQGAFGSAADYAAAFRHVVDVFSNHGVTNVAFVWNLMSWTFDPASGLIRPPSTLGYLRRHRRRRWLQLGSRATGRRMDVLRSGLSTRVRLLGRSWQTADGAGIRRPGGSDRSISQGAVVPRRPRHDQVLADVQRPGLLRREQGRAMDHG